jgi:hypothetical protein
LDSDDDDSIERQMQGNEKVTALTMLWNDSFKACEAEKVALKAKVTELEDEKGRDIAADDPLPPPPPPAMTEQPRWRSATTEYAHRWEAARAELAAASLRAGRL